MDTGARFLILNCFVGDNDLQTSKEDHIQLYTLTEEYFIGSLRPSVLGAFPPWR